MKLINCSRIQTINLYKQSRYESTRATILANSNYESNSCAKVWHAPLPSGTWQFLLKTKLKLKITSCESVNTQKPLERTWIHWSTIWHFTPYTLFNFRSSFEKIGVLKSSKSAEPGGLYCQFLIELKALPALREPLASIFNETLEIGIVSTKKLYLFHFLLGTTSP